MKRKYPVPDHFQLVTFANSLLWAYFAYMNDDEKILQTFTVELKFNI